MKIPLACTVTPAIPLMPVISVTSTTTTSLTRKYSAFDACNFVLADHNTTSTADYDFDYSFLTLFLHALLRSPPWKTGIQSRSRQVYADLFHYTVLTIQPRPTSDRPSSERPRNDSASFKNAMTPKVNSRDATLLRASLRVTLPSHAPKRRS